MTPKQRRKRLRTADDWANWACAVAVGGGRSLRINEYKWYNDILRGAEEARKRGYMTRSGKPSERWYTLTESGRIAAKRHAEKGNL